MLRSIVSALRSPLASRTPRSSVLLLPLTGLLGACGGSTTNTEPVAPVSSVATSPAPPPVASASAPAKPAYPSAAKEAVVDLYRDLRVSDDYRWLEDWDDPKVKAWSEAENAFTRRWLDAVPERAAIHARVDELMNDSSPSWRSLVARHGKFFALESRPPKQHPSLVLLASLDGNPAAGERVLVDPSAFDPSGATAIGWFEPTPDGKRVAVSLSKGGGERGDVHVFDVDAAKGTGGTGAGESKDIVPQSDGAGNGHCLAWKGDGSGFFYTHGAREVEAPKDGLYQRVYFHKLGDSPEKDVLAVGKDGPRLAQWEVATAGDGRTIVARMEYGDGGDFDQWLLGPSGKWTQVATKTDAVKSMGVGPDRALYLLSLKDAPKGKILRTSLLKPALATAEVIAPEGDAVIDEFLPTKTRLYLDEDVGGVSRLRTLSLAKGKASTAATPTTLVTPPVSAVSDLEPVGDDDVLFAVNSYAAPFAFYRARAKDGAVTKTALAGTSTADFKDVAVTREECTSKDGTKVPITLLSPKSMPAGGRAPTLLTGYGGFGIPMTPRFRAAMLAWLEQGGIYAVANLRGGGEFGEAWHKAGNLTHKQNVFDDFYACEQYLVTAKYTLPERLAIQGRSNGGLLMGAALTQHPEAVKAVVAAVGIYDMLRVERDSNGAFNTTEYGSVAEPEQFDALYAYSPYQHVKDGTAYPAVLFVTGANDPRVAPYHSRKMVARLQAATSSDAPILLRTSANSGHGGDHGSDALGAQIDEWTDTYAFLFHELGVNYSAKPNHP